MRILLTGANGQVGWELQKTLAPLGEVTALGRAEVTRRLELRAVAGTPQAARIQPLTSAFFRRARS